MSSTDQPPPHALFVQWGKFRAGAFGIPAIVALSLLTVSAAAVVLWK
jgi:hypothetical protein